MIRAQPTPGRPWALQDGADTVNAETGQTVEDGLRADIAREVAREDRDAWSQGYVYGLRHALRCVEVARQSAAACGRVPAGTGKECNDDR